MCDRERKGNFVIFVSRGCDFALTFHFYKSNITNLASKCWMLNEGTVGRNSMWLKLQHIYCNQCCWKNMKTTITKKSQSTLVDYTVLWYVPIGRRRKSRGSQLWGIQAWIHFYFMGYVCFWSFAKCTRAVAETLRSFWKTTNNHMKIPWSRAVNTILSQTRFKIKTQTIYCGITWHTVIEWYHLLT